MRRVVLLAGLVSWSLSSSPRDAVAQGGAAAPVKPAEAAKPGEPAPPAAGSPDVEALPSEQQPNQGQPSPEQQPEEKQPTTRPQEPSPLPPEPPSTAPAPVQPMPQVPPLPSPATSQPAPADEGTGEEPRLPPPESSLGPEVFAGMNARLNDNEGFRDADIAGLSFGFGGWFAPNRTYSLGLTYQRTSLGTAVTDPGENSLSARYDLNTVWFGGRAYPWRTDRLGLFILLELGASWQNVTASGTRTTTSFTVPAEGFACSATDSPGFALGGGAGLDVDIERNLAFIVQADVSGHRLSSEPVDGCAIGAGAATNLGARVGFLYRFDLDQEVRLTRRARIGSGRSARLR